MRAENALCLAPVLRSHACLAGPCGCCTQGNFCLHPFCTWPLHWCRGSHVGCMGLVHLVQGCHMDCERHYPGSLPGTASHRSPAQTVKAVCPAAASPGHPVHKSHLSSEGLAGGAPGLRGLCSWLGACCQQQVMQTFLTVILSCCSWMSRRMSLQRQHLAGQRIPSGSLHRACGHSSRQSAVLARQ